MDSINYQSKMYFIVRPHDAFLPDSENKVMPYQLPRVDHTMRYSRMQ
jgi:hypothetical protein